MNGQLLDATPSWWWTIARTGSTCDDCGVRVGNCLIAYESVAGSVICEACAEDRGVAAECRESRRARQARQLRLVSD